jgi:hypothetical protein
MESCFQRIISYFHSSTAPVGQGALTAEVPRSHLTTRCRVPLDKWSARRRDLNLSTQATHNRETSMPSVEFETAIPGIQRPQTYALHRATTGTDRIDGFTGPRKTHKELHIINGNCTKAETHTECKNSAESLFTNRHDITSQKTRIFSTAVISSNLTSL